MKLTAIHNGWTGGQFSLFRMLFGTYLFIHFIQLLPWATEVFSSQGMLANSSYSPLIHAFPNILAWSDAPVFVQLFIGFAALASIFFMLGYRDKLAAFFMWYVLACLFTRNPLIANPSLPYTGWMLLACCFIPSAPYGSLPARNHAYLEKRWYMPNEIFIAAWIVLAVSYSYSGYTKLLSPSWVDGNNIRFVLENPLARDYFLRDFFLWLPPVCLKLLTWSVLYIELFFAPLVLFARLRPVMWTAMLVIQCGFAFLLNFPDLTAAMILFHLFTFNPAWVKPKPLSDDAILYYDGYCALCQGTIRFILSEDTLEKLRFSPLQGHSFQHYLLRHRIITLPDTIILVQGNDMAIKSDAVIAIFAYLGGLWRIFGMLLRLIPKMIRDSAYDVVGYCRYKIFGRTNSTCPVLPPSLIARFVN